MGAKKKKKKQKRKKEKPSSGGAKSDSASDSQEIKVTNRALSPPLALAQFQIKPYALVAI